METTLLQNICVPLHPKYTVVHHIMAKYLRYIFTLLSIWTILPIKGQNYVKTENYLNEDETRQTTNYQYYDGLGRKSVAASNGTNTDSSFVYTMQTYDTNGREYEQWLPAVGTTNPSYPSYSEFQAMSRSTYNQDNYGYSTYLYDALDRLSIEEGAGNAWRTANRHTSIRYDTNTFQTVKRYWASLEGDSLKGGSVYYPAGQLTMIETTDEDGRKSQKYMDILDRKIMERSITGDSLYDTYYVYDNRNQLRFVLTPEFQKAGWKYLYAYEFRYDEHGRLVKKIRPQCGEELYYYDNEGRVVYTRDATGRYRFSFYDIYGRLAIKGHCSNFNYHRYADVQMQTQEEGLFGTGYQCPQSNTLTGASIDEVIYYDNYLFLTSSIAASSPNISLLTSTNGANAKGLQTGSAVRTSSRQILLTAYYYDEKGRVIDKRETLLDNGFKKTLTTYSFTDKPLTETITQTFNGTTTTITKTYEYFPANDQLKKLSITYNNGTPVTVAEYEYNSLGQPSKLRRGGNAGDTNFAYNLRGWITSITGIGFNEWLHYTDGLGTPYYNGNISSQQWKTDNEGFRRGYKFHYDDLNRMTKAEYAEGDNMNQHIGRYTEWAREYTFSNGIRKLERFGKQMAPNNYGKIDNLRLYYDGMQLMKVKEDAYPLTYTGAFDFVSSILGEEPPLRQYDYYDDGSLKWDACKGIALILYNSFNMPQSIQFTNGNRTEYEYSATGEKLRTVYKTAVPNITVPVGSDYSLDASNTLSSDTVAYVGDFIFENGQPAKYLFAGGYATISNSQPTWHYYVQDHLGNNRAVINHDGTLEQVNHYYPFGAIYGDVSYNDNLQKYKYNGKELDRMHGLNFYDYGARQYDPLLGMFTQMDPLAEKYYHISPYAYCANNPVNRIDPNGRDWYQNEETRYYTWYNGNKKRQGFVYIGGKGSVLGEFESKIHNILIDLYKNDGLYSEGRTMDITNPDKGAILPSDLIKKDDFLDEFVYGYGPEISILPSNHPYTKALKTDDIVVKSQQKLLSGTTNIPGQITGVSRDWGVLDLLFTPSIAKQFVGSYSFDSYTSNDGKHLLNIIHDTKNFRSLVYHMPGTNYFNHSRNSIIKPLSTTYQFYIWKSRK